VPLRLTLARLASLEQKPDEEHRLLAEALQRDPANAEALGRLANAALVRGPSGEAARDALAAAQAARPDSPGLALALARVLLQRGQAADAATLLDAEPLRRQRGVTLPLARSEAFAAAERWPQAEAAARAALAEDPASAATRRHLARLLARGGDARGAEAVLTDGLRSAPGDPVLQQALVALLNETQGIDAALAAATRLASQPSAMPAAAVLRGDILLGARRAPEAAAAYAEMMQRAPSGALALRQANALRLANRADEGAAVLSRRLAEAPQELGLLATLAQFDMAANRMEQAEARMRLLIASAPEDAVSLNNLAWVVSQRRGTEGPGRGEDPGPAGLLPRAQCRDGGHAGLDHGPQRRRPAGGRAVAAGLRRPAAARDRLPLRLRPERGRGARRGAARARTFGDRHRRLPRKGRGATSAGGAAPLKGRVVLRAPRRGQTPARRNRTTTCGFCCGHDAAVQHPS
jgi:predicted Zn-dependent protease